MLNFWLSIIHPKLGEMSLSETVSSRPTEAQTSEPDEHLASQSQSAACQQGRCHMPRRLRVDRLE